jgi:SpoVK/Ycf46/Vps4 family AAA+-type ATPase
MVHETLRQFPSPSARDGGIGVVSPNPVSWDSIGGLDEVKLQLQKAIEWPLKHPETFARLGLRRSKGCLLYGPPGCGKTKLVRAAASNTGSTFLSASAASIFSPYVGDSEKAVSELFRRARMAAPTVLFIDEIGKNKCVC